VLQLLEEDDAVIGVQYKDKETGDTKVRVGKKRHLFPLLQMGSFPAPLKFFITLCLCECVPVCVWGWGGGKVREPYLFRSVSPAAVLPNTLL
jgi:hypothetical protein